MEVLVEAVYGRREGDARKSISGAVRGSPGRAVQAGIRGIELNYSWIASAFNKLLENIFFYILTLNYYSCGVRSLTGYSRILIPNTEWDLLLVPKKESMKGLTN